MSDVFSRKKRSEVMSRIRGSGNLSTELRLIKLLRANGVSGWRRKHPLPGKPDFVFPGPGLCVFVDGCFWHACPHCFRMPRQNRKFWSEKISRNIHRDRYVSGKLRRLGWSVVRIRECKLKKSPEAQLNRILRKLN